MDIDENGPEDAEVNQGYMYILKPPPSLCLESHP